MFLNMDQIRYASYNQIDKSMLWTLKWTKTRGFLKRRKRLISIISSVYTEHSSSNKISSSES